MSWPIRVLHLGLGRFHRAHQASYFQKLFVETGEKWGVASFSMRSPEARNEMRVVHNHYPVVQFATTEAKVQWIDAIRASYFAKEDSLDLLMRQVDLVTLTVTEKAYEEPLFELLAKALDLRDRPLTILSCDNLQANGDRLRAGVLAHSNRASWIRENVSFPNSMVDRIVPALTPERLQELQHEFEIDNPELIATEVFTQWVIEDNFKGARPPLDKVGVQFVDDVKPFEEMKLKLLNAAHSLVAYAGLLKGYRFVHEAIRDEDIRARVEKLHREVRPTLTAATQTSVDLDHYCRDLVRRFDNERLPHMLKQIAMDGSQKLKQRLGLNDEAERVIDDWARYCKENEPEDPLKEKIVALRSQSDYRQALGALLRP